MKGGYNALFNCKTRGMAKKKTTLPDKKNNSEAVEVIEDQVIEAAQVTKSILDDMGVKSYCKTSGSTGSHIYIPLGNKYTYEQSKEFARVIVTLVHNELPDFTSIERAIKTVRVRCT
jgi:DNA primase